MCVKLRWLLKFIFMILRQWSQWDRGITEFSYGTVNNQTQIAKLCLNLSKIGIVQVVQELYIKISDGNKKCTCSHCVHYVTGKYKVVAF